MSKSNHSKQEHELLRKYKGLARLDDEEEFLVLADDDPMNLPDRAIDDEATGKLSWTLLTLCLTDNEPVSFTIIICSLP